MDGEAVDQTNVGVPELTELGKRIEMLRIERGISKQHLARYAGTSRQQLWRVMTGKSEMSLALRTRLADVLQSPAIDGATRTTTLAMPPAATRAPRLTFDRYLGDSAAIARTLATLPTGDRGRTLKRRLLEAIEDAALEAGLALDTAFFELRRRVLSGEL